MPVVSLPNLFGVNFDVYFSSHDGGPTQTEVREWIETAVREIIPELSEPFGSIVSQWLEGGYLRTRLASRDELPAPPADALERLNDHHPDWGLFRAASSILELSGAEILTDGLHGFWLALMAALACATRLDGVILDPATLLLLEPDSLAIHPEGRLFIADWVKAWRWAEQGQPGYHVRTAGMARFRLPELYTRAVPDQHRDMVGSLLQGLAGLMLEQAHRTCTATLTTASAERLVIPDTLWLHRAQLDRILDHPHDSQDTGLCELGLRLEEEGLEVSPMESWEASLISLFSPAVPQESRADAFARELEEAHQRAVEELPRVKDRFQGGSLGPDQLQIRWAVPFPAGEELLWVQVRLWEHDLLEGVLLETSEHDPDLQQGVEVEVPEEEICDWTTSGSSDEPGAGSYTATVAKRYSDQGADA